MEEIIQNSKLNREEREIEFFLEEKINTLTTSDYLFRQSDDIYELTFKNLINILNKEVSKFQKNLDLSLELKEKYKNKVFSEDIKEIFENQIEFQRSHIENYKNVSKHLLNFVEDKNKTKKQKIENLLENKDYLMQNIRVMNRFNYLLKENNKGVIQNVIDTSPNKSIMQFLSDKKEELFGNRTIKRTQKLK